MALRKTKSPTFTISMLSRLAGSCDTADVLYFNI
jgi:hypothetical protein